MKINFLGVSGGVRARARARVGVSRSDTRGFPGPVPAPGGDAAARSGSPGQLLLFSTFI